MVIKTELTVNGYKATVSPKLLLHKGDSVFLEITLMNTIINTIEGVEVDEVMPMQFLRDVKLLLQNPNGILKVESTEIEGNKAIFKLLPEHTQEVGTYLFQLVCYDDDDCIFHIPEVQYTIKEPIGII